MGRHKGWLAALLHFADHCFFYRDGPIEAVGVDDQMKQTRLFGHIGDATTVTLVFHGFLQWTSADRAMYHDMEGTGARRRRALSLPFNSPLCAFDVKGLCLCAPTAGK